MQPLPVFNFRVFITLQAGENAAFDAGDALAGAGSGAGAAATASSGIGFAEVSGLNSEMEHEEFHEGGRNIGARLFPRWGRNSRLVMRRGVTDSTFLWDWWTDVMSHSYTLAPTRAPKRGSGVVLLETVDHKAKAGWFFSNALPERLVGPGLHARGNEVAIETLELTVETLLRLPAANLPNPA